MTFITKFGLISWFAFLFTVNVIADDLLIPVPDGELRKLTTPLPLILMYHDIVEKKYLNSSLCNAAERNKDSFNEDRFCEPLSDVPFSAFAEQMQYLRKNGFETLSMDELYAVRNGHKRLNPKSVVITFDDGYEGNYNLAYHYLKSLKFKATFFVHTGYVGVQNTVTRNVQIGPNLVQKIYASKNHMSWNQLREMDNFKTPEGEKLFAVYSHTVTHPHLANLTESELASELHESRLKIEQELGGERPYLAYPFGQYTLHRDTEAEFDLHVITAVKKEGYTMALTIDPTHSSPDSVIDGNFAVPRVAMELPLAEESTEVAKEFHEQIAKFFSTFRNQPETNPSTTEVDVTE